MNNDNRPTVGLRFVPEKLNALASLQVDSVVVPVLEGRRQPTGLAGWIDWRLAGRLAKLIQQDRFSGRPSEILLFAGNPGMQAGRIFFVGAGSESSQLDRALVWKTLFDAKVRSVALGAMPQEDSESSAKAWLRALAQVVSIRTDPQPFKCVEELVFFKSGSLRIQDEDLGRMIRHLGMNLIPQRITREDR